MPARRWLTNPALERLAARMEAPLRRAFERAVAILQRSIPLEAIEYALARREVTPELLARLADLPNQLAPVGRVMAQAYERAAHVTVGVLNDALGGGMSFTLTDPRTTGWAAAHAGQLIRDVQQETVQAVRAALADSFVSGVHPKDLSKTIRAVVGLTERQEHAVMRYAESLFADGEPVPTVMSQAQKYASKLQKQRALLIARTESSMATAAGQQAAWQHAADQGWMSAERSLRRWDASRLPNMCAICRDQLNGQVVIGLNTPFDYVDRRGRRQYVLTNPAHPACQCRVNLLVRS